MSKKKVKGRKKKDVFGLPLVLGVVFVVLLVVMATLASWTGLQGQLQLRSKGGNTIALPSDISPAPAPQCGPHQKMLKHYKLGKVDYYAGTIRNESELRVAEERAKTRAVRDAKSKFVGACEGEYIKARAEEELSCGQGCVEVTPSPTSSPTCELYEKAREPWCDGIMAFVKRPVPFPSSYPVSNVVIEGNASCWYGCYCTQECKDENEEELCEEELSGEWSLQAWGLMSYGSTEQEAISNLKHLGYLRLQSDFSVRAREQLVCEPDYQCRQVAGSVSCDMEQIEENMVCPSISVSQVGPGQFKATGACRSEGECSVECEPGATTPAP